MTRSLTTAVSAAAQAPVVRPVYLARLDYASGVVRLASAPFDLAWGGESYLGVGSLGAITAVEEGADLQTWTVQLQLSGVRSELIAIALGEHYQGRDARLLLALVDDQHALIADPVVIFRGRMDTQDIELGETGTIVLTVQSRLADWHRPRVSRYTDAEQRARFAGDKGLQYVNQMADKTLHWGRD